MHAIDLQSVLTYKHIFWNKELHSNEVSLPFTMSRILGVIGSLLSHWSGRLIRAPDKDKDKNKDVNEF